MKKTLQRTIVAAFLVLLQTAAFSQITITVTDFNNSLLNSQRTHFTWNYDSSKSFNVGNTSNSEQTFDFSSVPTTPDTMRDTSVSQFIPPTGLPGASSFPDATAAQAQTQSQNGATITSVSYLQGASDGVYALGYVIHYYIPSVIDTTFIGMFRPKSLVFPLPMTLGTERTATDSVTDPTDPTKLSVSTQTYTCNGYGTLKLPDGSNAEALRVQTDQVQINYHNGSFSSYGRKRRISFWTAHLTLSEFTVDTTFSGGSALSTDFSFEARTGAAGVKETSKNVPNGYELSQNFPNPFNPTTTINFKVSKEGFTTLKIYDVLGQEVATVLSKNLTPGSYAATWNASGVQSGVYFYKLQSGNYSETKKLILMK